MPSKYDRLVDHLATRDTPIVTLSFAEVEAIVGPLPQEARKEAAWWGVTKGGRYHFAHTLHWLRAGYAADRPDFVAATVTFRRIGDQ